ncbi:MAG: Gfo/Idh/MocA family protein [Bacillota bacterium]
MTKDKVNIGIIGAGNIAQNAHIPAYLNQSDIKLAGVCDINGDRAKKVASEYDIDYVTTDIKKLVNQKKIDAVSVCTWNNAHAEAVIEAASAGKHILCEKPMAMNNKEAEKMMKTVKNNNIIFMMGFVNRFRNSAKYIKRLAEAGKLGDIYYGKAELRRRRGTPLGWFTDSSKSGGGPVIDIGVHIIDLTWYLMGRPEPISVSASTYNKFGNYETEGVNRWEALDTDDLVFDVEDSAAGFIRFENGASISFDVSWAINGEDTGTTTKIFGDKAGAQINPLKIFDEEENHLVDKAPIVGDDSNFDNEIRHFLDCVKEEKEPMAPVEDGVIVQKILDGIYESAEAGKEISL